MAPMGRPRIHGASLARFPDDPQLLSRYDSQLPHLAVSHQFLAARHAPRACHGPNLAPALRAFRGLLLRKVHCHGRSDSRHQFSIRFHLYTFPMFESTTPRRVSSFDISCRHASIPHALESTPTLLFPAKGEMQSISCPRRLAARYMGMLPCFFGGRLSRLAFSMRSVSISLRLVSRG